MCHGQGTSFLTDSRGGGGGGMYAWECLGMFGNVLGDSKKFYGWVVVGGIFAILVSTQVQTS